MRVNVVIIENYWNESEWCMITMNDEQDEYMAKVESRIDNT
jgi:hypothetical protein